MKAPTIHRNGTSGRALLLQVSEATAALRRALSVMRDAAPNGRDYYVQGDDAFTAAAAEHRSRVQRVEAVLDEYSELYGLIYEQTQE